MYPQGRSPYLRPQPNYTVRRIGALVILLVVLYLVFKILGAITGALFGGDDDKQVAAGNADSTTTTTIGTTTTTIPPLPECKIGDLTTEKASPDDWQRSIVDTERALPADYDPGALSSAADAGFTGISAKYEVRTSMIGDLKALREAAADNGTPIDLIAAYRSVEDQAALYQKRVAEDGEAETQKKTARPGHSEHHLGTTVDFRTFGASDVFQEWAQEPTGQWMLEHAWEYGFINSYPDGKKAETCYEFEPWHYRYLGVDLAKRVHDSGMSLRAYLWQWQQTGTEPS